MSIAADLIPPPDPLAPLTPFERSQAEELAREGETASSLAEAAIVVAGGFLLYREYMRRRLLRASSPNVNRGTLRRTADRLWLGFAPTWLFITSGALSGAARGGLDVEVPEELLWALGEDYARRLGPYLHESSTDALTEGFTQHVNRRVPAKVAADRAIAAFGLTTKQTRGLNAMKAPAPVNNAVLELNPNRQTDLYIERALVERAQSVGKNESFSASQEGRQLGWLYQVSKGVVPATAEKMWVTARDERTCSLCGPMHRVRVKVTQRFDTPAGPMWSPSMHPNCRCELKLTKTVAREKVAKARDGDGDGSIFDGTKMERLLTQTTEETRVGGRVGGRIGGRVEGRVGGRVGGRIEQRMQAPTAAPARVSGERVQLSLPRTELARLVNRLVEVKTEPILRPAVQTQTRTKPATTTSVTYTHKLDRDVFYVAESEGDHGYDGRFHFTGQEFGSFDHLDEDIHAYYDDMLSERAEEIVADGQNVIWLGNADTGEVRDIELDREQVRAALEAELYGMPNEPLRHYAHQLGFDRYEHAINVFVVREINTSESEGDVQAYADNDLWEIHGDYVEDERGFISEIGVPLRHIWVSPDVPADEDLD